jgi:hypothetical protein
MADRIENLKQLAAEFSIRSAEKLRKQALLEGTKVTRREAEEALKTDLAKQVFAPKPRSLGKSAAEGPNNRLQFDLIDFSNNTKKDNPNRFALVGIDVYTREMSAVPMKTKTTGEVNAAFRKAAGELVGQETGYVATTDAGGEFAKLEEALPEGAVHRQKDVQDRNAIAVLDRNMQGLKVGLAGRVAKGAKDWSVELPKEVNAHNSKPHEAVYTAPSLVEGNGGDNPAMFRVMQDNASKYVHNRSLTQRRMGELKEAGAFRAPTGAPRSFQPQYGNIRRIKAGGIGSQYVHDVSGRSVLLKNAQAAPVGSINVRQTLTIPGKALAVRLKGAADQVQAFLASQPGGEMQVTRLEAMVKADGVGLSGVQASIRKNRSTFRRLLNLFKTHFTVRNGVVKTTVVAPAPAAVETPEERTIRMDRQYEASQRLRDEQDRKREEKKQAARDRLRDMRGVYGNRPAA